MAFFRETTRPKEPFLNAPPAVLWLVGAILAAHAGRVLLPPPDSLDVLVEYAFVPARYYSLKTYFTYIFVHGGLLHAAINSLWLLAFGPPVLRRIGTGRFLAFYVLCGVAAAAAHLISDWGSPVPVVGASGAISGLMAGAVRIMYGFRLAPPGTYPPLAPVTAPPVLFFSSIWLAVNFVVGFFGVGFAEEGVDIAWVAHMGGFLAGLITIGYFDRDKLVRAV